MANRPAIATGIDAPPGTIEYRRAYHKLRGHLYKNKKQPKDYLDELEEAPGLKPQLTAEYKTCGKPELPVETYIEEVTAACKAWWPRRRGIKEPYWQPISWDTAWIKKAIQ